MEVQYRGLLIQFEEEEEEEEEVLFLSLSLFSIKKKDLSLNERVYIYIYIARVSLCACECSCAFRGDIEKVRHVVYLLPRSPLTDHHRDTKTKKRYVTETSNTQHFLNLID
jgi:hypothetical protein